MKQFGQILKFELKSYLNNKIFVGVTVFLVAAIAVVMFFPRITGAFGVTDNPDEEFPVMLIADGGTTAGEEVLGAFSAAFSGYDVRLADGDLESIKAAITSSEAECAFVITGPTSYTYYVNNLSMYDSNTSVADEVLKELYRMNAMVDGGLSYEEANSIMTAQVEGVTESLGKDQMQNFFYTYIMTFALYMVILLYGQMVATNVASEKSSRAMELLITSAKPTSMMFGKVIASCIAGFAQLAAVFGASLLFYNLNSSYWSESPIIALIFDIPPELFVYMLVFFVLGFLIYAFLFGAVGSTISKLEDINTAVMPLTMLFIVGFVVVVYSMSSGDMDNILMKVCSYIPFTSPMAMFTRVAMTTVPIYEIIISIAILIASVIGVGFVSAKIYRMGVLLYGNTPKLGAILKAAWKA